MSAYRIISTSSRSFFPDQPRGPAAQRTPFAKLGGTCLRSPDPCIIRAESHTWFSTAASPSPEDEPHLPARILSTGRREAGINIHETSFLDIPAR